MSTRETPYRREDGYAKRYRDRRFCTGSGPGTHRREVRALGRLLAELTPTGGTWLDVPSGAGRMTEHLPVAKTIRCDRDPSMVQAADPTVGPRVAGSVHQLPFAAEAFSGALCFRLLHHIPTAVERQAIFAELRRVVDGPLAASFFDSHSIQHWRRLARRRLGKTVSGRCAASRNEIAADLEATGWRVERFTALGRFVREQTLVLAQPRI